MKYSGSFAGCLVSFPDHEITYTAYQTILVSVQQQGQILTQTLIDNIDHVGQPFELLFDYINLVDPVQLIFETHSFNDQFNRDCPVTITQLVVDDLFTIPHFLNSGKFSDLLQEIDTGNVLWKTGKLVYTSNLPMCNEFNIVKRPS